MEDGSGRDGRDTMRCGFTKDPYLWRRHLLRCWFTSVSIACFPPADMLLDELEGRFDDVGIVDRIGGNVG